MLLVGGQTNVNVDAPDDQEARTALMRVLAHALRAEKAPRAPRVRTVGPSWTAEDIAAKVTSGGAARKPVDDRCDRERQAIGKAYADWRAEVLGLVRAVEF